MVTEFGMSESIGAISLDTHGRNRFLDMQMGTERGNYGEETAREIDGEVRRIVSDAHQRARAVLAERRETLEQVARRLLEKEVIEGEELRGIVEASKPTPTAAQ
jgi:cell division protease FtsH